MRLWTTKWWIPLALGVIGSGAGYGLHKLDEPVFTSTGQMIVNVKLSLPEGSVYTEELSNFLGTQAALMQSGVVLDRAHEGVLAEKAGREKKAVLLSVTVLPKTTIFGLQATGPDPVYTQRFLQGCMDEYIKLKKEMRLSTSDTTVAGLTEEVLRLEKKLRQDEKELGEFQSTNGVVLLQEPGNNAGTYLAALNQRLAGLKAEYELLRRLTLDQNLERPQQGSDNLPASGESAERIASSGAESDYLKAKQQLILLRADRQEMSQYLRPKHPRMVAMDEEIARRERVLEIFRQQGTEQLESRKIALAMQIQTLEKTVGEWEARTLEASLKTAEFQRLKENVKRTQVLYDRLAQTLQTLDVNKDIVPESVTVMERASRAVPARSGLTRRLLLGALAGVGAGILVLVLLDRLDDRLSNLTEFQDSFEEQVLAQVPRQKLTRGQAEIRLIGPNDERHAFVESFRNLRSSLLFLGELANRPRTLVLTSSIPNEGKSMTAANLAVAMADAGTKVLLVDADMRKGGLHRHFDAPAEPGLSQALLGAAKWSDVVRKTAHANLWIVSRGAFTQRSSELFLGAVFQEFLAHAKEVYDMVLIDTPPVMAADDVTTLAPLVDGLVFVLRAEHTSARVARAALESLYQRDSNVIGIVLNSVRPRSGNYYYYYQYRDYCAPAPDSELVARGK
jgi:succinoglycan biosynthesis transport protein ExoP